MRWLLLSLLIGISYGEVTPHIAELTIPQNVTSESLAALITSVPTNGTTELNIELPANNTDPCIDINLSMFANVNVINIDKGTWCGNILSENAIQSLGLIDMTLSGSVMLPGIVHDLEITGSTFLQNADCCGSHAAVINVPQVSSIIIEGARLQGGCRLFGDTVVNEELHFPSLGEQNILKDNAFCHGLSLGDNTSLTIGEFTQTAFGNITGADLSLMCGDVNKVYNKTSETCDIATCTPVVSADHMCNTVATTTAAPDPDSTEISTGTALGIAAGALVAIGFAVHKREPITNAVRGLFFSKENPLADLRSRSEALSNVL
mgnify:CR=1 FL=1